MLLSISCLPALSKACEQGLPYRHWYETSTYHLRSLAAAFDVCPNYFADVLAITSPRVQISRNLRLALTALDLAPVPETIMAPVQAALDHYHITGVIRGPKTSAFAAALKGDLDAVVLDVHMATAFGVPHKAFGNLQTYSTAASFIRRVAADFSIAPAQTQAAIWSATVPYTVKPPHLFHKLGAL